MSEFIASIIIMLVLAPAGCAYANYECESKASRMGFRSDWGPVQGCMIQVDKHWIPIDSYRTLAP